VTDTELKTYLAKFEHSDTGDVKRQKFVLYAKKSDEENWTAIGYKQESAAISNNYDTTELTDVLGDKYNEVNDKNETIEMSEYHINKSKSDFLNKAFKYTVAGLESELTDYSLLMVFGWLVDESGNMLARKVDGVSLRLDNLGGQSFTMADVSFSGISKGEFGTVSDLKNPTFTAATAAA